YKKADILILPATYSNGNMTITEAKASGMGLVLSDRINSVTKNNKSDMNCFVCDLNIDEFVSAVEKYILNPDLLCIHGRMSRDMVMERRNSVTAKYYHDLFI